MVAAWLLAVSCATASAEVVDRTIAEVNKHLVTWSDLDEQMRFEALENERPLKSLTAADRRTAFDHLVQDWILRDQMQGMLPASESDVDTRIAAIRDGWKMGAQTEDDDAKWVATLEQLRTVGAGAALAGGKPAGDSTLSGIPGAAAGAGFAAGGGRLLQHDAGSAVEGAGSRRRSRRISCRRRFASCWKSRR